MPAIAPRGPRRAAFAAAAAASLTLAAPAAAHDVPLSEGSTTLQLRPSTVRALRDLDVRVTGTRFRVTGAVYSYHELNDDGGGSIEHDGTLTLRRGEARARLTDPRIVVRRRNAKRGVLRAEVGGDRVTIGRLDLARYRAAHGTPGFNGLGVALSAVGARVLNEALGTSELEAGLPLGTLRNRGRAPLRFTGGATTVILLPATVQTLTSRGVTLAPDDPATGTGTARDPFSLPVSGGVFDYAAYEGSIEHTGGLRIAAGAAALDARNLVVRWVDGEFIARSGDVEVLALRFVDETEVDPQPVLRIDDLEVHLAADAARALARATGFSTRRLTRLRLGTADVRGEYRTRRTP